jgi:hypothetical protein
MASLHGTWLPLPGRIVDIAATNDTLVLAEVPEDGSPMRVHVGRWQSGEWRGETPWTVPPPPRHCDPAESAALAVAEDANGLHVAVTRVEFQGGSYGIALATLANGSWAHPEEIESPTDSDIPFGDPVRRHANEVFTFEETRRLWHYTRSNDGWAATPTPLRDGSVSLDCPHMALGARGLVVANETAEGEPLLLIFEKDDSGRVMAPTTIAVPGTVGGIAYGGEMLYLGFRRPDPTGAVIWAASLPQIGSLEPTRRFSFPAPHDPKLRHIDGLDASADWLLVRQPGAAWVAATSGATPHRPRRLAGSRDLRRHARYVRLERIVDRGPRVVRERARVHPRARSSGEDSRTIGLGVRAWQMVRRVHKGLTT